jgi:hypothetical protein
MKKKKKKKKKNKKKKKRKMMRIRMTRSASAHQIVVNGALLPTVRVMVSLETFVPYATKMECNFSAIPNGIIMMKKVSSI